MTTTLTQAEPQTQRAGLNVSAIPFSRLVRVEWGKATDTRSARWLLVILAFATVGITLAPLLARKSVDQTWANYLSFPALVVGMLLPVVAILTMTTEWTQRTVLTTFTLEPRRSRMISAKVTVSVLLGLAAAAFALLATAAAVGVATATGRHIGTDLHAAKAIGFVAFVLLNVLMGVAFGALLHNTAAAIVVFFIVPTAFGILGSVLKSAGDWFNTNTTFDWVLNGEWSGHTGKIVVSTAIWVVIPIVAGLVRTARREIK